MEKSGQKLLLSGRELLEISGVAAVESFDNDHIWLTTSLGGLEVEGTELKIDALNLTEGQVTISGAINGLQYGKSRAEKSARQKGKNVISRLLK